MDIINKKQIKYWQETATENLRVAQDLFKTKHYDASLFFCHLTLEKILKGLVVKNTKQPAPYIHDLAKLSELANLKLPPEDIQTLRTITTFNISGRYENIKLDFYKRCTKDFTIKYLTITQDLYLCLKKHFLKK
jgi:HEPN domain-containing protein